MMGKNSFSFLYDQESNNPVVVLTLANLDKTYYIIATNQEKNTNNNTALFCCN